MKYLIAGLGNIGPAYANTRHNAGFLVLDELAQRQGVAFSSGRLADVAEFRHKGRQFTLIKPSTYMNLSGKALRYWLDAKKVERENLLVVVDELALPFGKMRLRKKGSDGGHNGLKNIDLVLGNNEYPRLRFGIGNDFGKGQQVDYVLGEWGAEERAALPALLARAADCVLDVGTIGIDRAMNLYN